MLQPTRGEISGKEFYVYIAYSSWRDHFIVDPETNVFVIAGDYTRRSERTWEKYPAHELAYGYNHLELVRFNENLDAEDTLLRMFPQGFGVIPPVDESGDSLTGYRSFEVPSNGFGLIEGLPYFEANTQFNRINSQI